ncbi:DUF1828 domain-containing protein [Pseudoramibacter alactolyticus]|jgi:hypothetical protein|uniref:DUF1828 domain-containing protein n=1 Tax=Pseudoramibacter alactolyticus TaxID=113287 RepID=UPI00248E34A0|nr:DUF1828 domain-containing protein [Pseudoramibacter alactolyticus]
MKDMSFDFKSQYINWLKGKINQERINKDTYRITMPFLDRNNDYVDIYIVLEANNNCRLTDDGNTLQELELSGFDLSSSRRTSILQTILNSHGIKKNDDAELYVECNLKDISQKKHMLAQCIVKVSDLFYLSRSNVKSLFLEDVANFLLDNNISYTPDIAFVGKSQLTTRYDFVIGRTKKSPARAIQAINNLDINKARYTVFNWNDTQEARNDEMHLYTFIQDTEKKVPNSAINALEQYNITPILWSNRNKYITQLAS